MSNTPSSKYTPILPHPTQQPKPDPDAYASEKKKRGNQHKPAPPEALLKPLFFEYWNQGLSETKIHEHLLTRIDRNRYGLSLKTLKRLRIKWGVQSTRQQGHSVDSIAAHIQDIRRAHPRMGARTIVTMLRKREPPIRVPEKIVADYLKRTEPDAVLARCPARTKALAYTTTSA